MSALGEDDGYRASDLECHGPSVYGWLSRKNCIFPQQLVIFLNDMVVVQQIQILAHHYMISDQIDIWLGPEVEIDIDSCIDLQQYKYAGFVTFSNNEETKFKCREMKSVTLPYLGPTRYVKFILHRNHANAINIFNQVAIVAVQIIGKNPPSHESVDTGLFNISDSVPSDTIVFNDLAFEMYVDKEIVNLLKVLDEKKKEAVKDERFEFACKLKHAMTELHRAGEILGRFQIAKNQAIQQEDYSRAKRKKSQIDDYKKQLYSRLNLENLLEKDGILLQNDEETSAVVENEKEVQVPLQDKEMQPCVMNSESNFLTTQLINVQPLLQGLLIESRIQISGLSSKHNGAAESSNY